MLKLHRDTHLDHGITTNDIRLDYLLKKFADRTTFFIETVELLEGMEDLRCELHGPLMGDLPVPEGEARYIVRGPRKGATRVVQRAPRPTRLVTIIAGHGDGNDNPSHLYIYTVFGGPPGAKEVWDPSIRSFEELEKARAFWRDHALSWNT